jgi:hypothetical protein
MKKLIVIAIVGMMVMGMGIAAHADTNGQWTVFFTCGDGSTVFNGAVSGAAAAAYMGTQTGALNPPLSTDPLVNAYDSNADTKDGAAPATTSAQVILSCFDSGIGKTGKGNGYTTDMRAPGTANNAYNLKVWVDASNANATAIKLQAWNPTTAASDLAAPEHLRIVSVPAGVTFTDYSRNIDGSSAGGLLGTGYTPAVVEGYNFTFLPTANGTNTASQVKWQFNVGTLLARGQANAIQLQLVPEPGSMLAMLSGLVGLVGYGIRRRK